MTGPRYLKDVPVSTLVSKLYKYEATKEHLTSDPAAADYEAIKEELKQRVKESHVR